MTSVLLTGGTGTFSQAMARRLLKDDDVDRIAIYSRGELAQADMARELSSEDVHKKLRFFIGDVRDRDRLTRAMRGIDLVYHAAALKRIEVGRYCPEEMVKTNVLGSMNVIESSFDAGVKKVVALSTDKAWQPISPYGQSKALAESLFLNAYEPGAGPAMAVCRYGNIWKSNGSVVPYWQSLINQGCSGVPVTDPECTRFYMTIDEALTFVQDTAKVMKGGELRVPDLPAYRLGDLCEAMGARPEIIGLPPWEKLHEGMEDGKTSDVARRMTIEELREAL